MKSYKFNLFADYFQFYLQDEEATGNLSDSWTDEAVKNLMAIAPGKIGVGTVRNMTVPVEVQICESEPKDTFDKWDKVNECTIETLSGKIIIAGCSNYLPEAKRIFVKPGNYRARIYYGNLKSLSEDGLDGDDYYKIALWQNEIKTFDTSK